MNKIRFLLGRYASVYTDYSACMYWGIDKDARITQRDYWLKRLARKGVDGAALKYIELLCDYDPGNMSDVSEEIICEACDKVAADIVAA